MKNVNISLYELSELSDKARNRAIEEHREFLLSEMRPEDFISGDPDYDTPEELRRVYEAEYDYYSLNDDPVIESIKANDYLFFASGELAHVLHYCGNHQRAGETVLLIGGEEYILEKEPAPAPVLPNSYGMEAA